ncbi:MAG: class I SAM-dependent methyltransferase [Dermatophilaceae bacterium]
MGSATVQGELWGRHPQTWADGMERRVQPLHEAAQQALGPWSAVRYLDAGCGSGLALELAAAQGAVVTGLDASAPLLEVARNRIPDADLHVGDLEALPFDTASFDVVTAFNSIQYAQDPAAAIIELARVTRSGGKVAIGLWGDPAQCETEALFAQLRALAPPPPGTPAPLGVSAAGVVEGLLDQAGLTVQGGAEVPIPISFADHDEAWRDHTAGGPPQKLIDTVGPAPVRQLLHDVLESDRKPDGSLRQDNVMRYVTAIKP